MKKISALRSLPLAALCAAIAVSCNSSSSTSGASFETDSIQWADSLSEGKCKAMVAIAGQYPKSGPQLLVDSTRAWIADCIDYTGPTDNGADMVKILGASLLDSARVDFKEYAGEDFDVNYDFNYTFGTEFKSDSLVTEFFTTYKYLGGAHGMSIAVSQTFNANTGVRLTDENIFLPGKEAEVAALVRNALWVQFFEPEKEESVKSINDVLFDSSQFSLPAFPPAFGAKGLTFTYQQYEIVPYAFGMPSCTISYDNIRPYLRPEIVRLLPQAADSEK